MRTINLTGGISEVIQFIAANGPPTLLTIGMPEEADDRRDYWNMVRASAIDLDSVALCLCCKMRRQPVADGDGMPAPDRRSKRYVGGLALPSASTSPDEQEFLMGVLLWRYRATVLQRCLSLPIRRDPDTQRVFVDRERVEDDGVMLAPRDTPVGSLLLPRKAPPNLKASAAEFLAECGVGSYDYDPDTALANAPAASAAVN